MSCELGYTSSPHLDQERMYLRIFLEEQPASHSTLLAQVILAMFNSKHPSNQRAKQQSRSVPHRPILQEISNNKVREHNPGLYILHYRYKLLGWWHILYELTSIHSQVWECKSMSSFFHHSFGKLGRIVNTSWLQCYLYMFLKPLNNNFRDILLIYSLWLLIWDLVIWKVEQHRRGLSFCIWLWVHWEHVLSVRSCTPPHQLYKIEIKDYKTCYTPVKSVMAPTPNKLYLS